MSKNNKDDIGGMKPVKPGRGSSGIGSSSRPSGQRTPSGSGKSHFGILSKEKSSGSAEKSSGLAILTQNGIVELLEQDDRPTFAIDLAEQTESGPGPLKIVYANASLRAVPEVLESISGITRQASPSLALGTPFSDFKSWCTSYVKDHEPRNVTLPSFVFAAVTWDSTNLLKRFRVFRGHQALHQSINLKFAPKSLVLPSRSPASRENDHPSGSRSSASRTIDESPQDYFGPAGNVHITEREAADDGDGTGEVMHGLRTSRLIQPFDIPLPMSPGFSTSRTPMVDDNIGKAYTRRHRYTMFPDEKRGFFDWTRLANAATLPRHIRFAKSIDWASTSLGPCEGWSSELRSMCNLIMASPHPAAMYWGPDLTIIYNEAYIYLAGQKHPQIMGQNYCEAWAEIWDSVKDVFHRAIATGESTMKEDDCLFIQRATLVGNLEEAWFDWSIIPLVGNDGSVVGLYNPAFEKTKRKVGERRLGTLSTIGEKTSTAKDVKTFWKQVISGLEPNVYDAPFFLLYSVSDDVDSDSQPSRVTGKQSSNKVFIFEGSVGVPAGRSAAPPRIDSGRKDSYLARIFNEASVEGRPLLLSVHDGTIDRDFLEGLEVRGYPEPCNSAVCCAVQSTRSETLGHLLMGINPRRPYDDEYSTFIQMLSRQISTALASVVLFEEELRAGERARRKADRARLELSEQLAVQKQVALDTERRFTQMAKFAPVGIFMAGPDGVISYRNDKWYEIMKLPVTDSIRDSTSPYQWIEAIHDEDEERVERLWSDLVHNGVSMCTEVRFKSSWVDQDGKKADTWALASGFPDKDEDGHVKTIYGSITDISHQKWVELREKKRMEAAVELKRHQERFVDIISHELRNPIAAMFLCSEEITDVLSQLLSKGQTQLLEFETSQGTMIDIMQNALESANTITQCAQHQKRIVDDILTMSKMDSAMLLVTPSPEQPEVVVRRTLKMFEQEVKSAKIRMDFQVDDSFRKLNIDWVQLDRSRLAQVLINLVTNAIKFTTTEQRRAIVVTLSATVERPSRDGRISYFPPRIHKPDLTENAGWGQGEQLYMHLAVKDTGRGLSEAEKKLLFLRFSQASPSTHVQYGGSGLGLFISRELVELQSGEIGVASQSGKGSTFAFFIRIRRATKPHDTLDNIPAHIPSPASRQHIQFISTNPNPQSASTPQTTPITSSSLQSNTLNILIVEDNPINQKALARALHKEGAKVYLANHGEECLSFIKESTFWTDNESISKGGRPTQIDLILMDEQMPIMDGTACTKTIRKLEREGEIIGHIPIILVTGDARAGHTKEAGFDEIVTKPFTISELLPVIKALKAQYPVPNNS